MEINKRENIGWIDLTTRHRLFFSCIRPLL